jgi:curved DNA-binding protein CbpA
MSEAALDPYAVLGVAPEISDAELRRVYRDLVKRHHPDHNAGSPDAARRFAQIQTAYAAIASRRRSADPAAAPGSRAGATRTDTGAPYNSAATQDPLENRIAAMERELAAKRQAEQRRAQEQARQMQEQAAKAAATGRFGAEQARRSRPTPEELGYYSTDDSFTQIIDDAAEQLGERLGKSDARKQFTRRLSELFGRGA